MTSWPWLLGAVVAAAGSYLAGWRTWSDTRARRARELNADRYLAWRGRAGRPAERRFTRAERQRLIAASAMALVAIFCVVGFFTYA